MDKLINANPANKPAIIREEFMKMLFVENIIITLSLIYFFIFFRTSKPPTPPSHAASRNRTSISQGFIQDTKILFKNTNYILIVSVFTFMYCVYASFGFFVASILYPFGYSLPMIAVMAVTFVLIGAPSAAMSGKLLDRTGKYVLMLKAICFMTVVVVASAYLLFPTGKLWAGELWCILAGFFIVPIVPVSFNFISEVTFPLAPAWALNLALIIANIGLTIVNYIDVLLLLPIGNAQEGVFFLIGSMVILALCALLLAFFVKEDLRRKNYAQDIMERPKSFASSVANSNNLTKSMHSDVTAVTSNDPFSAQ